MRVTIRKTKGNWNYGIPVIKATKGELTREQKRLLYRPNLVKAGYRAGELY